MSNVMRKPVFAICEQQKCRSACTSAQSDQRICYSLLRQYNICSFYMQNLKPLACLYNSASQFEPYLVANLEDRFSRNVAQTIIQYCNDPKFSDRYAWANSEDPRSSLIRVYTVCHSVCIVWTHYSMVEPHSSNFRVITTNFLGFRIFRKSTVSLLCIVLSMSSDLSRNMTKPTMWLCTQSDQSLCCALNG